MKVKFNKTGFLPPCAPVCPRKSTPTGASAHRSSPRGCGFCAPVAPVNVLLKLGGKNMGARSVREGREGARAGRHTRA